LCAEHGCNRQGQDLRSKSNLPNSTKPQHGSGMHKVGAATPDAPTMFWETHDAIRLAQTEVATLQVNARQLRHFWA
jgi:hypothetical protein